jgi:hypothetical protein
LFEFSDAGFAQRVAHGLVETRLDDADAQAFAFEVGRVEAVVLGGVRLGLPGGATSAIKKEENQRGSLGCRKKP